MSCRKGDAFRCTGTRFRESDTFASYLHWDLLFQSGVLEVLNRAAKSVQQECEARVSFQERPARVSSQSLQQKCQARASSNTVKQECQKKMSRKNVKQRVSRKNV